MEDRNAGDCGGSLQNVAIKYGNDYHPYLAIVVCTFGTVANILNIIVLTRKDMFCAPINRILTALAVADMVLMVEYIPYAYYYYKEIRKNKEFTYLEAVYLLFHNHITQYLHTTSICLTLTLAIWRYLAIGYPQKSNVLCSERRCTLAITLSFFLPIILCAPTYIMTIISQVEIRENNKTEILYKTDLNEIFKKDTILLKINFWIYAVFIKVLPCFILTVISIWLIYTIFKAKKRRQVLRSYDSVPLKEPEREVKKRISKAERRADRTTKMLVAVLFLFLVTEFPQGIFGFLIGIRGKDLFLTCYQSYGEIMDILALINGAINFILYCCMNRMFRTTFEQLFVFVKHLMVWTPSPETHTTTVGNGTNATEL